MRKKWLITLVGLTMALGAITGAGFALAGNGSDNEDQDVTDEWKLVEASGWPGGFSLRLPQEWQLNELQGIDSYVGEIIGGGGRLNFDFGWYSSSLVDDDDPRYIVTYEEIGGRLAKLVRPGAEGDGLITGVYFEDFDGSNVDSPSQNRLQISGVGLTPAQQETTFAIFRTIRPLDADQQPSERLWHDPCVMTEIGYVGPIEAFRGTDHAPTGFDPVNGAGCTFNHPITSISLELLRDGARVLSQTINLDPPSEVVGFPLSQDLVSVVPADLEPGRYDRRIQVTSVDGDSMVVVSDTIWVFDPDGHPVEAARRALAEMLGVASDLIYLLSYDPAIWGDASLGCPEPGTVYDQVETPGFRLVFTINTPELWEQRYEYHTNVNGSMTATCEVTPTPGPIGEFETPGDQPPIRSDDDIDPNECNRIHNIGVYEGEAEPKQRDDAGTCCKPLAQGEPDPNQHDGRANEPAVAREPGPGIAVGAPYPLPTDKACAPDQAVAITSGGQVSCLNLANDNGGGQDMVSPGMPRVVEPAR